MDEFFDKVMWKVVAPFTIGFFHGFFAGQTIVGSVAAVPMVILTTLLCFLYILNMFIGEVHGS